MRNIRNFDMRLVLYIFFLSQLLNFLGVFAEKVDDDASDLNQIKWRKIEQNKSNPLKKTIWKSYNKDYFYFEDKNEKGSITNRKNASSEERKYDLLEKSIFSITEIEPFLPLNKQIMINFKLG